MVYKICENEVVNSDIRPFIAEKTFIQIASNPNKLILFTLEVTGFLNLLIPFKLLKSTPIIETLISAVSVLIRIEQSNEF